jgi:raffinose/stachyose/melibiose transport system permease protein
MDVDDTKARGGDGGGGLDGCPAGGLVRRFRRRFLGRFPREIIEAARIDGANRWQVLWRIVVPVSRPTIGVLLVFFFIWTWNEFLLPLVMLISHDNQTVSVALGVLQGQQLMDATMTNAAALLGVLPAIVFFLVFQRTLTRGIAVGAVK